MEETYLAPPVYTKSEKIERIMICMDMILTWVIIILLLIWLHKRLYGW